MECLFGAFNRLRRVGVGQADLDGGRVWLALNGRLAVPADDDAVRATVDGAVLVRQRAARAEPQNGDRGDRDGADDALRCFV